MFRQGGTAKIVRALILVPAAFASGRSRLSAALREWSWPDRRIRCGQELPVAPPGTFPTDSASVSIFG